MEIRRKKRNECFFGMHSDFHAKPEEGLVIGASLSEEDIREICESMKPDFIQIDCKGHPGYTSYPSEIGNAMPDFACDPLQLWRRVTKEYGIPLYMHFSGVYDIKYCAEHPEDRTIKADGSPMNVVRMDGKYLDEYFIPQVCELVDKYDVDGLWVDGECWAVYNDYHPETIAKFEKQTGISLGGVLPAKKGDPYFQEYTDFTREEYRKYLRYYVDQLHEKYPDLEICSNWAFSDHMPEAVCANVDFLSGDLNPLDCVNSARYAGRMLASQGKPWDLMAWGFRFQIYHTPLVPQKHPVQIMHEAAAVISLGGAFQNNISQFTDGSPDIVRIRRSQPVADFVHARREYCFGGKIVRQAVMLVPTYDRYMEQSRPFSRDGMDKLMGLTALLCDSGITFEIANEATLRGNMQECPLIIIPELYCGMAEQTIEELRAYVHSGGSLLLIGTRTAEIFANAGFGFSFESYTEVPEIPNFANCDIGHKKEAFADCMPRYFSLDGEDFGVAASAVKINAAQGSAIVARIHTSFRDAGVPVAAVSGFGKGRLGIVGANLGTDYSLGMQYLHRTLIREMTDQLYDQLARVESCDGIAEINCLMVNDTLNLQLLNAGGAHANLRSVTESYIPPLENLRISVREDQPIDKVILRPGSTELPVEHAGDRAYFTVPRVEIHSVAQICFQK